MRDDEATNVTAIYRMLVCQARVLHGYFAFDQPQQPLRPLVGDLISESARSLPLLDYLYDKELQLVADVRPLLERYEAAATTTTTTVSLETCMTNLELAINEGAHVGGLTDLQVRNLRTLYRFRYDNRLEDHSEHYQQGFLPFYRFSRHKNFSQAFGATMKRNVRRLYEFVREIVQNSDICPCIILYNLFIRDSFRLFSFVSMQHCNYVRVYDDETGQQSIVSYVELSNKFPQIAKWFPTINSQYVKKYGPHSFQKLDVHVGLMLAANRTTAVPGDNRDVVVQRQPSPRVVAAASVTEASGGSSKRRKKLVRFADTATTTTSRISSKRKRIQLKQLFPEHTAASPSSLILDRLFRSNYRECKHSSVVRVYVQIRSGDESASMIVRCRMCGKRL